MVICYLVQSQNDYTELLFSLRSVARYFIPPYEVYVVGEKMPEWLTGVTQICIPDLPGRKQMTIKKKIYSALEIVDEIFLLHDDCYLLTYTDGKGYPYYYQGTLNGNGESGSRPLRDRLNELKKPTKNFDIHQPIVFDKRFKDAFAQFPADVIVKSCYCNYFEIPGEPHIDLKINKYMKKEDIVRVLKNRKYFSSGASGLNSLLPVLHEMFPDKSPFEI